MLVLSAQYVVLEVYFFGSYVRNDVLKKSGRVEHYQKEQINNILKQSTKISDVVFKCSSYDALDIPANSIIYCDPPYNGTTKYKDSFDSDAFWQWCRDKAKEGHTVYVSEYNAPEDFKCIWEKQINSNLGGTSKTATEKLFTI